MKNLLLSLLVALVATSCMSPYIRDRAALPAIQTAWVDVRADIVYGETMTETELIIIDAAVANGVLQAINVPSIVTAAHIGVSLRLTDGLVGPIGASILMDRATNFGNAIIAYRKPLVVSQSDRPLVITRSSWATHPPSTIARRVYR